MKTVLLISNVVFHYRIAIYNRFYDEFRKLGYEFHVLSNEYQDVRCECKFIKHVEPFSVSGYINIVRRISPDIVINFLHLKDRILFPLTIYCRIRRLPIIYWNHGINLSKADNKYLNIIYRTIHAMSNAIILYTPNEIKYISRKSRRKVFIAYNTLCFDDVDWSSIPDKETTRNKYSIEQDKIILFISRILPYKRLDLLLNGFLDERDVALVIVGPGISEQQRKMVDATPHYYYLGEKYGKEVDEIYNMGDVYSTPGHIGLGLIQAFYWGKPVVVMNVRHAPEIYYMNDGENGFLADTDKDFKDKILYLLRNKGIYNEFSRNASETVNGAANINKMFGGFREAVTYCIDNSRSDSSNITGGNL